MHARKLHTHAACALTFSLFSLFHTLSLLSARAKRKESFCASSEIKSILITNN